MSNKDLKYKNKYLKYKNKYLHLQSQIGGVGIVSWSPDVKDIATKGPLNKFDTKTINTLTDLPDDLKLKILSIFSTETKDSFKSIVDKYTSTVLDNITLDLLKEKLKLDKSIKKEDMFLSPIDVYHPEYLEKREIFMLAKIFIDNINKPNMINRIEYKQILPVYLLERPVVSDLVNNKNEFLSFNLEKLKNFLLSNRKISEPLELIFKKELYIDDNQLDFELFFIFICILIKYNQLKSQQIPLTIIKIELLNIDLSLFRKSFNEIIFGLNQNIIKKLSLSTNKIDDEQATLLATALTNTELIELSLDIGISISNQVAQALVTALTQNTTLTKLSLDIGISNEVVQALATALTQNTTITTLEFRGNRNGDNVVSLIANVLKQVTKLSTLKFYNNRIRDGEAIALANALINNITLTTLILNHNALTKVGVKKLANALTTNQTLKILNLKSNDIDYTGANELAKVLKNTTITELTLDNNNIGDIGAINLANALIKNQRLEILNLFANNIGSNGAIALVNAIKNTILKILNLGSNNIRSKGAIALANALTDSKLEILFLNNNRINYEGASALAKALTKNQTLKILNLKNNDINYKGVEELANALDKNTTLTKLDFDVVISSPQINAKIKTRLEINAKNTIPKFITVDMI